MRTIGATACIEVAGLLHVDLMDSKRCAQQAPHHALPDRRSCSYCLSSDGRSLSIGLGREKLSRALWYKDSEMSSAATSTGPNPADRQRQLLTVAEVLRSCLVCTRTLGLVQENALSDDVTVYVIDDCDTRRVVVETFKIEF
uniref:Uncharacterized protein n=1 Tax=Peronospora matthiolae TaxID=2874970 RepID=A0AAV1TVW5_9STRA